MNRLITPAPSSNGKLGSKPWAGASVTVFLEPIDLTFLDGEGGVGVGQVVIEYVPDKHLVGDNLHSHLQLFRALLEPEAIVVKVADDFMAVVKPKTVTVTGQFRGRVVVAVRGEA